MSAAPVFEASPQVVVHGGGIAGLWILRELLGRGLDAMLVESDELGAAQTVASQGVIHGGVKYALNGVLTDSSEAIRGMPGRWSRALQGGGAVDLRGVGVLSDHQVLWSSASITGRLTTFFASRALSSRLSRVEAAALPEAFHHPGFKGSVYRIEEQVLDIPSVVSALATPVLPRILRVRGVEFSASGGAVPDGDVSNGSGRGRGARRASCLRRRRQETKSCCGTAAWPDFRAPSAGRCAGRWSACRACPRFTESAWGAAPSRSWWRRPTGIRTAKPSGISAGNWPNPG
ncbi:MAG: FAD-dependent oxidoreductase [Kiritimatiellia bacterium]